MRISSRESVAPITLHQTVRVYPLLKRWALAEETKGTYLEFIDVVLPARAYQSTEVVAGEVYAQRN